MVSFPDYSTIKIQSLSSAWLSAQNVEIAMLRLDLLHPDISGNKWFKLKYNLESARQEGKNCILTFGGAWSNHIAATAAACDLLGFKSIGIIRGTSQTFFAPALEDAAAHHMQLEFISREQYRKRDTPDFLEQLNTKYNHPYIIPEGGDNPAGIKGCTEILSYAATQAYTDICCAVGSGTTLTGLIESALPAQKVWGFAPLKQAGYLREKINNHLSKTQLHERWQLIDSYHFGGFAKTTPELLHFMHDFHEQYHIPLDFVYTGKMMFGMMDFIKKGHFSPGSRILAIHTGGLQGNRSIKSLVNTS